MKVLAELSVRLNARAPFSFEKNLKILPSFLYCLRAQRRPLLRCVRWKFAQKCMAFFPPVLMAEVREDHAEFSVLFQILRIMDPFGSLWQAWILSSGTSTPYFSSRRLRTWSTRGIQSSCSLLITDWLYLLALLDMTRLPLRSRCLLLSSSSSRVQIRSYIPPSPSSSNGFSPILLCAPPP